MWCVGESVRSEDNRTDREIVYAAYEPDTQYGDVMTLDHGDGLYETSLVEFGGDYYLSFRNKENAYVARSNDGLYFGDPKPWRFDDGQLLGSDNFARHSNDIHIVRLKWIESKQ